MICENIIEVICLFRYIVCEVWEKIWVFIYLLYGYGQLSWYFICKMDGLNELDIIIVVLEGIYWFYLNGYFGRVGVLWMMREVRELDICENILVLNWFYCLLMNEY